MSSSMSSSDPPGNAAESDVSEWQVLAGLDPAAAEFPTRAKFVEETIVIFRAGAKFFGVQRACPHQGGNMAAAVLQANDTLIRCTRHNYVFRVANGKPVNCPGFRLTMYDVKEEGGRLLARIQPAGE